MILSADTERRIEQVIAQQNILNPQQLQQSRLDAIQQNKSLLQLLVDNQRIKEDQATRIMAMSTNTPFVDLATVSIPNNILALIPREVAESFMSVAFGVVDGRLNVATIDPQNLQAIDFLSRKTGYPINAYMAPKGQIEHWINSYTSDLTEQVEQALGDEERRRLSALPRAQLAAHRQRRVWRAEREAD